MINLYHTPLSRSMRVKWLLEEMNLEYQETDVPWRKIITGRHRTPEYLKKHPLGLVPVLEDGEVSIFESMAICHYLAETYGADALIPAIGSEKRAEWLQWMYFIPATLEPPIFTIVKHSRVLPEKKRQEHRLVAGRKQYHTVLKVLDRHLSENKYLLGDEYMLPDIALAATLLWSTKDLGGFSAVEDYLAQMCQLESFKRAYDGLETS